MKKKYCFVAVLLLAVAASAMLFVGIYRKWETKDSKEEITVVTSFYPIYIAAANVVGDCEGISLSNLSEPQTGCLHDFVLTPEDMKLLSFADLFLVNGGGMESFLDDVAGQYPNLLVERTADTLSLPDGNAHVWMSIKSYRAQVLAIAEKLCEIAPNQKETLWANAKEYDEKLAKLQDMQEEIKEAAAGSQIVSFHEAFEYLAKDYEFPIAYALNLDEERQIGAGEVADVLAAIEENGIRMIFAEELYGSGLADTIQKETDIEVYYLDTLVRGEYDLDSYLDGMAQNINILKKAFGV